MDAGIEADLIGNDGIYDGHEVDEAMELGQVVRLEERFVMSDAVPEYPDPFDFIVERSPISGTLEPWGKVRAPERLHVINGDTVTPPATPRPGLLTRSEANTVGTGQRTSDRVTHKQTRERIPDIHQVQLVAEAPSPPESSRCGAGRVPDNERVPSP